LPHEPVGMALGVVAVDEIVGSEIGVGLAAIQDVVGGDEDRVAQATVARLFPVVPATGGTEPTGACTWTGRPVKGTETSDRSRDQVFLRVRLTCSASAATTGNPGCPTSETPVS
jgi:hypothetical protein